MRISKGSALASILVAMVGGIVLGFFVGKGNASTGEPTAQVTRQGGDRTGAVGAAGARGAGATQDEIYRVPVGDSPARGPAGALVTIVEFSDFQCPFCTRVGPTLRRIQQEYGDRVRIVFKNNPLPFHENAMQAAELAQEALAQRGADGFWRAHDLLFENQRALARPDLERLAGQLGLDMSRVRQALDGRAHQARVQQDMQLAARLGARGTPAFFINGRSLTGAQPYEEFKRIIDEEITRANRVLATGVPRSRLYAELTKNGRTSAQEAVARGAGGAAGATGAGNAPQPPRRTEDPTAVYRVPVTADQPSRGARNALVTIVNFSEFQCPFSKRVDPTVQQILERYPTQVRVVWRNNPLAFHDNAVPAAELAQEAFAQRGAEGFWRAHDLLFANQQALARADLDRYAGQLGLDMDRYRAAMDDHTHRARIEADLAVARQLGANGTPSFYINGVKLRGAQPFEAFQRLIDEQIARAQEAIRAGRATPANVYDVLTRDGATAPALRDAPAGAAAPAANREPTEDPNRVYDIAVPARAPTRGNPRARVTIQLFSDFQCPFCSRVLPTVRQIEEQYGDRVRIVFRDYPLPFHDRATQAAEAAREVFAQRGNDGFWRYHDLLFQNQRDLSDETLVRLAGEVGGVNMDRFRQALSSRTHQAAVRADADAVTQAGARIGTPSFFINGRLVQGAQPIEAFRPVIDAALAASAGPSAAAAAGAAPRPAAPPRPVASPAAPR